MARRGFEQGEAAELTLGTLLGDGSMKLELTLPPPPGYLTTGLVEKFDDSHCDG